MVKYQLGRQPPFILKTGAEKQGLLGTVIDDEKRGRSGARCRGVGGDGDGKRAAGRKIDGLRPRAV